MINKDCIFVPYLISRSFSISNPITSSSGDFESDFLLNRISRPQIKMSAFIVNCQGLMNAVVNKNRNEVANHAK